MINYIIRRLLILIPILLGLTIVVFLLLTVLPGDPARLMAGEFADPETVESIREEMGFNKPIIKQYFSYLGNLLKGDFGRSYQTNRPVIKELAMVFPKTVYLALVTEFLSILIGVTLGMLSASKRGKLLDRSVMVFGVLGLSLPLFWLALILQILFSIKLGVLPPSGYGSGFDIFIVLPALTLALPSSGLMARVSRSAFLEIIPNDYVRMARAKGIPKRMVVWKHTFKNALIPILSLIGTDISRLFTGIMIIEVIFSWPGIGKYGYDALFFKDMPALQGTILTLAVSVCLVNLIIDLLYAAVDPRVRYE
jgi:peptide/nickel transport system permease protein